MKAVVVYVFAIVFCIGCQKEIIVPQQVKEEPQAVVVPEPEPEPEPEPVPEPEPEQQPDPEDPTLEPLPGEISETVYLRNLPYVFNSVNHYKLVKVYSAEANLWHETAAWLKDDIHIFNDLGTGSIHSPGETSPQNSFSTLDLTWTAFFEGDAIKLSWVDENYEPTTYNLVYAIAGKMFKASRMVNDVKIFYVFAVDAQ